MDKDIAIVEEKHWIGKEEYWGDWICCPKCKKGVIARSNYCSNCGIKLVYRKK